MKLDIPNEEDCRKGENIQGRNAPEQNVQMKSKSQAVVSIGIFLGVCLVFMLLQSYSYARLGDNEVLSYITYMVYLFSPLIGCVAARLIPGEGFQDGILWPRFTQNKRAYLLAVLLPTLMGLLGGVLSALLLGEGLSIKVEGGLRMGILMLLLLFGQCYYTAFITAGEEFGWRALLYDKLEVLIGTNGAVILGGIIWGVWHLPPLYYTGINFGKDYPGFPFVGVILMCVATVFIGAPMWLVRKMSCSVIPACIFHGIIDSVCSGFLALFLSEKAAAEKMFQIGICGFVLPCVIIGIPGWIYLVKWTKKKSTVGGK